jgi:crotonobetainyl-CoA:carnitine CoA-transferase CaiB-like acyl-CoA transferase
VTAAPWFSDNAERSKRSDELYAILAGSLGTRTSKDWLAIFEGEDVPCGPINDTDELLDDPHLAAVGFFDPIFTEVTPAQRTLRQPVLYRGMQREADRFAPALGADTRVLMTELGYSDADVQRMTAARIVAGPELTS